MYIVKIYRRDEKNPYSLIGVVEDAATNKKLVFRTPTELVGILLKNKTWASSFNKIEKKSDKGIKNGIPVQISGIDDKKKKFMEKTAIVSLTPCGGQIMMRHRVKRDTKLVLKFAPVSTGATVMAKVLSLKTADNGTLTKIAFETGI